MGNTLGEALGTAPESEHTVELRRTIFDAVMTSVDEGRLAPDQIAPEIARLMRIAGGQYLPEVGINTVEHNAPPDTSQPTMVIAVRVAEPGTIIEQAG